MSKETRIIQLEYPIEYKDDNGVEQSLDIITIGRLKLKHIKHLQSDNPTTEDVIKIISSVSGISMELLDEIDMADMPKIQECVESFLKSSPAIGKK